jgi:catechol 2,3-dioxygenase-like lactoylglutathione lyase family enzyme
MKTYDHVAFQVSSMDAAIQFYVEKLGFVLKSKAVNSDEHEAYAFLMLGDLRLELIQDLKQARYSKPEVKPPYCPHLAIETDDMNGAVDQLRQRGVTILRGPLKIDGEETWVYFADLDNNVLEYIQWFRRE